MPREPRGVERELLTFYESLCIDVTLWPWALLMVVMTEWIDLKMWAVAFEKAPTTEISRVFVDDDDLVGESTR